jgi:hypothetical protein
VGADERNCRTPDAEQDQQETTCRAPAARHAQSAASDAVASIDVVHVFLLSRLQTYPSDEGT